MNENTTGMISGEGGGWGLSYEYEKAKGVVKGAGALFAFDCRNYGETAWGEGDGDCDPETSVRGQSCRAESIPHSHLPRKTIPRTRISKQSLLLIPPPPFFFNLTLPAMILFVHPSKTRKTERYRRKEKEKKSYHMPASNCTSPPYANANPTTIFGSKTPLV